MLDEVGERFTDVVVAACGRQDPVAKLGSEVDRPVAAVEQADGAQRSVGLAVGDAPFHTTALVAQATLAGQPFGESGMRRLGASGHEAQGCGVGVVGRVGPVAVAPGAQPQAFGLDDRGHEWPDPLGRAVVGGEQVKANRVCRWFPGMGVCRPLPPVADEPGCA